MQLHTQIKIHNKSRFSVCQFQNEFKFNWKRNSNMAYRFQYFRFILSNSDALGFIRNQKPTYRKQIFVSFIWAAKHANVWQQLVQIHKIHWTIVFRIKAWKCWKFRRFISGFSTLMGRVLSLMRIWRCAQTSTLSFHLTFF